MGEAAPFDDFRVTHGMCEACADDFMNFSDANLAHAMRLRELQERLYVAGLGHDLGAAHGIIEEALAANVRAVDILSGLVAPILYKIGEDWKRGIRSVAEEHRMTAFCSEVFALISRKVKGTISAPATPIGSIDVLLMNAPANSHTLGIRILALLLETDELQVHTVDGDPGLEELIAVVGRLQPRLLLISMALAEQRAGVAAIVERLATLPAPMRPKVIVGGYAVKLDLVAAIPGAEFVADISSIRAVL